MKPQDFLAAIYRSIATDMNGSRYCDNPELIKLDSFKEYYEGRIDTLANLIMALPGIDIEGIVRQCVAMAHRLNAELANEVDWIGSFQSGDSTLTEYRSRPRISTEFN